MDVEKQVSVYQTALASIIVQLKLQDVCIPESVRLLPKKVIFSLRFTDHSAVTKIIGNNKVLNTIMSATGVNSCNTYLQDGIVKVELMLPERYHQVITFSQHGGAAIGVDTDGKRVPFKFLHTAPHTMIGGGTGSGKSEFVKTLIAYLMCKNSPSDLAFCYVDPHKQFETFYNSDYTLYRPAVTSVEISDLIDKVYCIFRDRMSRASLDEQAVMLYIDEAVSPDVLGKSDRKGTALENYKKISEITEQARKFNIYVVVITQTPNIKDLGVVFKQCARRIGGLLSASDSRTFFDTNVGAQYLGGNGDMIQEVRGEVTRFQSLYLDDTSFIRPTPEGFLKTYDYTIPETYSVKALNALIGGITREDFYKEFPDDNFQAYSSLANRLSKLYGEH